MKKYMLLSLILAAVCFTGCNLIPKSPDKFDWFETNPQKIIGYGYVNQWINCSEDEWERMADLMVASGLNATQVELLSYGIDGYYENFDKAIDKFKEFAKVFKYRNITIIVTVLNWNVGDGLPENGKMSVCAGHYDMAWYQHIINRLKNEVGTTGIIIETASEWGPGSRNSQCWKKAEQFSNWTAQNWDGLKLYNKEARPNSAPAGHIIGYHILNERSFGPKSNNKIISTDTSSILNYLGGLRNYNTNHDRLAKLVKDVKKHGCGFMLYDFCSPGIDYAAIEVIGAAYREE